MSREFVREDYLKIEIEFTPLLPAREVAIAWLDELGFEVFEPTDTGLIAHTPLISVDRTALEGVRKRLIEMVESLTWKESIVPTENWNAEWESNYSPVDIDGVAQIRAPFHKELQEGLDVVIKPDMSFGTGHHETTYLMIKSLIELEVKGLRVLDMGCGTGVLAIAAKLLGASDVLAIDIEEGAISNTISNALLNGLDITESFAVDCGTSDLLHEKYAKLNDVVLANINRNVLLDDIPTYNKVMKDGSKIVLSGFFTGDYPIIEEAVIAQSWVVNRVLERNGWSCIICGKPSV